MKFRFTDEQEMLRRTAGAFARQELKPEYLREIDASGRALHRDLLPRMASLGFTALCAPIEHGGLGGGFIDKAVLLEELGRTSLSAAAVLDAAIGSGCEAIKRHGSDAQQRDFLPKIVQGEMCFAFSEGDEVQARALPGGDGFVIDGAKATSTGAAEARCLVVAATTGAGISMFTLSPQSAGISFRRIETMGMRGAGGFYEVRYGGVKVPHSALLGELNKGHDIRDAWLRLERLSAAAYCVGCAQQAIDDAVRYAGERRQFGQPIGKFQAIAHLLADLQVQVDGARWLLYRAAWLLDGGASGIREASMASVACSEALLQVTSDTIRVFGGYGLTLEFDIQRHFRDARKFVAGRGGA
jgi:alkylation response protein AidB-like acyl-CoA dehydrogenase